MTDLILQERVSLKPFNTFAVEAQAAWYGRAADAQAVARGHAFARERGLPLLLLGGGSNLLFVGDFPGVVLHLGLRGVEDLGGSGGQRRLRVAAGEPWAELVDGLVDRGIGGLENLAGIPGTAGAAPVQNIGAYGVELAERLDSVEVWDPQHGRRELAAAQCDFGYRDSLFKHDAGAGLVILALTLRLPQAAEPVWGYGDLERELAARGVRAPSARDVRDAVRALRARKLPDPAVNGNAGSFFKNPVVTREQHAALLEHFPSLVSYPLAGGRFKIAAGWLIEACGLRGAVRGRAGVHPAQALVLVNRGGATGSEILELAGEVAGRVQVRFGVRLEPEVRIIGAPPPQDDRGGRHDHPPTLHHASGAP